MLRRVLKSRRLHQARRSQQSRNKLNIRDSTNLLSQCFGSGQYMLEHHRSTYALAAVPVLSRIHRQRNALSHPDQRLHIAGITSQPTTAGACAITRCGMVRRGLIIRPFGHKRVQWVGLEGGVNALSGCLNTGLLQEFGRLEQAALQSLSDCIRGDVRLQMTITQYQHKQSSPQENFRCRSKSTLQTLTSPAATVTTSMDEYSSDWGGSMHPQDVNSSHKMRISAPSSHQLSTRFLHDATAALALCSSCEISLRKQCEIFMFTPFGAKTNCTDHTRLYLSTVRSSLCATRCTENTCRCPRWSSASDESSLSSPLCSSFRCALPSL